MTANLILQLDSKDNVLVALQELTSGMDIKFEGSSIIIKDTVPAKHKVFINDMQAGDKIIMYGVLAGKVQHAVKSGERMTTENTRDAAEPYGYRKVDYQWHQPDVSKFIGRTFNGYHRNDGNVGTANYWLFIPTVFCENRNMDVIKEALHQTFGYAVTDKYKLFSEHLIGNLKDGR